jgi:surface antigen
MKKWHVFVAGAAAATLLVGGGVGFGLALQSSPSSHRTAVGATLSGGKGGGADTGPQPGDDYPAPYRSPTQQDSRMDPFGELNRECVSFVAFALYQRFSYHLPFYGGNASDWLAKASRAGVPYGTTPVLDSVGWNGTVDNGTGHVALVVGIDGDLITIEQYNADLQGNYSWDVVPVSEFTQYIYFVNRPAVTPPPTTTTTQPPLQVVPGTVQGSSPNLQGSSPNLQGGGSPGQGSSTPIQGGTGSGGGTPAPATTTTTRPPPPPTTHPTTTQPPATTTTTRPPAPATWPETAGGVAHTWSNPQDAGGTEGANVAGGQTIQISCRLQGFKVQDGNTWWYKIASSPWNNAFYVSADAFYNNGATSGSLIGTPFVDQNVAMC